MNDDLSARIRDALDLCEAVTKCTKCKKQEEAVLAVVNEALAEEYYEGYKAGEVGDKKSLAEAWDDGYAMGEADVMEGTVKSQRDAHRYDHNPYREEEARS